jgi:4a-hydroxytetrahydrobiopterin dehydratase
MDSLLYMKCVACRADAPPATADDIAAWLPQLPAWKIVEREGVLNLERVFKFKNFAQALAFTDEVGDLAEEEGHHPDILTQWGRVTVWWSTHKIKNLHRNDFIMAARTDVIFETLGTRPARRRRIEPDTT